MRLWQRQLQGRAGGKEQINLTHSRWAGVVGVVFPVSSISDLLELPHTPVESVPVMTLRL